MGGEDRRGLRLATGGATLPGPYATSRESLTESAGVPTARLHHMFSSTPLVVVCLDPETSRYALDYPMSLLGTCRDRVVLGSLRSLGLLLSIDNDARGGWPCWARSARLANSRGAVVMVTADCHRAPSAAPTQGTYSPAGLGLDAWPRPPHPSAQTFQLATGLSSGICRVPRPSPRGECKGQVRFATRPAQSQRQPRGVRRGRPSKGVSQFDLPRPTHRTPPEIRPGTIMCTRTRSMFSASYVRYRVGPRARHPAIGADLARAQ